MNYIGRSPGIVLVGDLSPVGAIGWFHAVPKSYLQLNGQSVTKAAYPDLWTYAQGFLTANQATSPGLFRNIDAANFAVPNLAGLFVRAPGGNAAALGVLQQDDFESHVHLINAAGSPGSSPNLFSLTNATAGSLSTVATGGTETRPQNVALIPCIKATPAYVVPPFVSGLSGAITASLAADVALNNVANYFDGPQVAQGNVGTFFVSGTVSLIDTGGAAIFHAKLWDGVGPTIAAAIVQTPSINAFTSCAVSGLITNPVGNLRISCKDQTTANGVMKFNLDTGKNSTITAIRVG